MSVGGARKGAGRKVGSVVKVLKVLRGDKEKVKARLVRVAKWYKINVPSGGWREKVLQVLGEGDGHLSVKEVEERAGVLGAKVPKSVVLPVLRFLEELELVGLVNGEEFLPGEGKRWESRATRHHFHVVQMWDGKIVNWSSKGMWEQLQNMTNKLGGTLVGAQVTLYVARRKGKAWDISYFTEEGEEND